LSLALPGALVSYRPVRWCCAAALLLVACGDTGGSVAPGDDQDVAALPSDTLSSDLVEADAPVAADVSGSVDVSVEDVAPAGPCVSDRRPIVAAHGFIASGDTWAPHARRLMANGYCREDIHAFDWNSVSAFTGNTSGAAVQLAVFVDEVLEARGATQVDLIGHSAGGGVAYTYLADAANAAKVANYAHVGSFQESGPAGPTGEVPTLNVWSDGDMAIEEKGDIPGATNVHQATADHYGVATNQETFQAIFTHFNDGEIAAVAEPPMEEAPTLWGRAVTFGENTPIDGEMAIYALDPTTGARVGDALLSAAVSESGHWGPFAATAGVPYELMIAQEGNRPVHYLAEPFTASNPLVYLRGFPDATSMVGMLLASLPYDDVRSMLVVFSSSRALVYPQDSLTVDGVEILSPETASAANSSIAFFLYDVDEDGETSLAPNELFGGFPFLAGVDMALPASEDGFFTVAVNGRAVVVPARPSETEGASVVVFE